MSGISIHDRVRIIKNEQELDTSGADTPVPPHGTTHVAAGSDPVPPEIDGITADMSGITDGQVPAYDLATNTFIPGAGGGGGVPDPHAPTHAKGGTDEIDQAIDGILVDTTGITAGQVPVFTPGTPDKFLPGNSLVTAHAATHNKGGSDELAQEIDGILVDTTGIADEQVLRYNSSSGEFEPSDSPGLVPYIDFEDGLPAPAHFEGRVFYDDDNKCLAYYNDRTDVTMQLGRENWVRCHNDTGVTITNGQVVYVTSATAGGLPTIGLAAADMYGRNNVLAIATEDILDGEDGECTRFGLVNDLDTADFSLGDILYLDKSELVGNEVVNGDFENGTTTGWTPGNSAALSASQVSPFEGMYSLRVTESGGTSPYARQTDIGILTTGKFYRLTGAARGDGSHTPAMYDSGGVLLWTGTTSTTWQEFDITFKLVGTYIQHYSLCASGSNGWAEYDNLRVVDTLIQDGMMEETGVADWSAGNSAVLTKSVVDPYESTQALRVTAGASTTPFAFQALVAGTKYKVTGAARGDGTVQPKVINGTGVAEWTGTSSTTWQTFSFVVDSWLGSLIGFASTATGGSGNWVEYDAITVEEIDYIAGRITNVRQDYPSRPVVLGRCLDSDALTGSMLVTIEPDDYQFEFEGTVIERQDCTVLEISGTVYEDVELDGGGDLPVQLGGDVHLLDCTTTGPARVALTAGTDTVPQINFVFISLVSGVATLKSSVTAPSGAFAFVAYVSLWSAAKTATDGPALHQRSTDAKAHDGRGRIAYIDDKIRQLGATWANGVTPTTTITTQGAALDNLDVEVTPGLVWQLHPQFFPALDSAVDGIYVANASGTGTLTNYQKLTDLNQCLEYSDGTAIPNGERYNLVIWGAVNKTSGECKLFVNLPTSGYTSDDSGYYDVANTAVTSIDRALFSVAFLIVRIPVRYRTIGSGTISFINPAGLDETISLLGTSIGSSAGGASGGGGGASTLNQLSDVTITTPADGQVLEYNSTSALWENVEKETTEFYGTDIEELLASRDKLGLQLMDDSNCEASGVTDWTASGSATLTKNNSTPPGGGTQSLKIAYNAVANPRAQQDKASSGLTEYILTFWARGDGTNAGSYGNGATTLGTIALETDWLPYYKRFTGSSVTVWFEAASVASAYIQIDSVCLYEIRDDVVITDELYVARYRENLLKYSEDYDPATTDWLVTNLTVNDDTGMVSSLVDRDTGLPIVMQALQANTTSTTHYMRTFAVGLLTDRDAVYYGVFRPGTYDYALLLITTAPNAAVYFDLRDGTITGSNTFADVSATILPGGDILMRAQFRPTSATLDFRVYMTANGVSATFAGDEKDGIYVTGLGVYQGTLEDNIPYIKTTTPANTGQTDFLLEASTPKEQQLEQGTLERVVNTKPSGIFETPQADVLYVAPDHMQHLGLGNRVYCQVVAGVGVSGDVTTTVAQNAQVDVPVAIHGWCQDPGEGGGPIWYQMGYYASTTLFARGKIESDELIIERGTAINGALDPYHVSFYFTINENANGV